MISNTKPSKPSPDFPLFPHACGKWAKKINGKLHYFSRWDDPAGALRQYEIFLRGASCDSVSHNKLTIRDACNEFLTVQEKRAEAGEISRRTFIEYKRTCLFVADTIGRETLVEELEPQDFERYKEERKKHLGIVAVGNDLTRVRSLFKWCKDTGRIKDPVCFGQHFKRASAKALRRHRRLQGKKLFTADQVHALFHECGTHLQAMVLLGINCGFGNTDCATLPLDAVDLEEGWVRYPRPKTEVDRDVPLWKETIRALKRSLKYRPAPKDSARKLFFVMNDGEPWNRHEDQIAKQIRQAMGRARIRRGGFYWLRHTFETIAGGAKDQVAVDAIMGHVDASMAAVYREEIEPERLRAVVDHVRRWWLSASRSSRA